MKIQRQRIIFIIFFLLSVVTGYLFWDLISLQFKDQGIIGQYSIKNYNAANDILRYILFLLLPCTVFIFYNFFTQKFFFNKINNFLISSEKETVENSFFLSLICVIFLIFIIFEFLSIAFPINIVDSFHDGQKLSSAYKYYKDGSLWSGSYITVGIFYESLSSSTLWKLYDHISIGLARFAEIIYIFIFKALLIFFIYLITKASQLELNKKIIYFIFNTIIFISLVDYNLVSSDSISYREMPIILLLILFTLLLTKKKTSICILSISILSPVSMFWGVDRGLICNILILIILLYLLLSKRKNESLLLFSFIVTFWFFAYLYLGDEFKYFLNNTYLVLKEMPYVHGLIHPKIFSGEPNAMRATKTIILILINLLISINLFFKKKYPINFSKIIIFLSLISVGSYLYALGRSDGGHIKNSFGFPLITFSLFISYTILRKYLKNLSVNKSKILSIILVIFFIFNIELNTKNIFSYNKRLNNYIYLPDNYFLNYKEKNFVNFLKPKLTDQSCIQLFSNDAIFYYILRKSSCTKYYFIWSAASKLNQKQFIKEMSNSDIIITGGEKNNWDLPLKVKNEYVYKYIINNYELSYSFKDWEILIKKY